MVGVTRWEHMTKHVMTFLITTIFMVGLGLLVLWCCQVTMPLRPWMETFCTVDLFWYFHDLAEIAIPFTSYMARRALVGRGWGWVGWHVFLTCNSCHSVQTRFFNKMEKTYGTQTAVFIVFISIWWYTLESIVAIGTCTYFICMRWLWPQKRLKPSWSRIQPISSTPAHKYADAANLPRHSAQCTRVH